MIKTNSGFSLVEIVVVMLLMGILGTASMVMLQQQNNTQVLTEASFDAIDLANEIRIVLSNPKSCKATFQGASLVNGTTVNPIQRVVKDPVTGSDINQVVMSINDPPGSRLKLKSLTLVSVDAPKGLATLEVAAQGTGANLKLYKKLIPLIVDKNPNSPTLIENCVAVGGPSINPVELCTFAGGVFDKGKCSVEIALDTQLPTYCPPGSETMFEIIDKKPRIKCIPCTTYQKFDHWECGKPFSSMNWVNKCYYRTVCANNQAIELFEAEFDQKVGPTSASGGDTGSYNNCKKKRNKCAGE